MTASPTSLAGSADERLRQENAALRARINQLSTALNETAGALETTQLIMRDAETRLYVRNMVRTAREIARVAQETTA